MKITYQSKQSVLKKVQIGTAALAVAILLLSSSDSSAVEFSPGEYKLESYLPAYDMGRSKQVIDKRCKHINTIGWRMLSKPECELLSSTEKDNKLSYEVKCSGETTGNQKLRIEFVVYKDNFEGEVWFSDKDKMIISGKKVSSCSTGDNLTTNESTSDEPEGTFLSYVKRKYQNLDLRVTSSDVVSTKDGKSGHFSLSGDIVPHKKPEIDLSAEPNRDVRAREIAKAFLEDEQVLFDIKNLNEISEFNVSTDKMPHGEYTHLNYKRQINGVEVEGAYIQIVVGPSENITSIQANLVAIPNEAYEATTKSSLSEREIVSIVETDQTEQDIKQYPKNDIVKTFRKIVVANDPYVLWDVHYRYKYRINAFTGELLQKDRPRHKGPKKLTKPKDASAAKDEK
ncbi:hypothetical protein AOG1_00280 [Geobacter sp. AOG1]|nr:hypothetical protein AOG1_00280 [Geobacter sp. AOG1]